MYAKLYFDAYGRLAFFGHMVFLDCGFQKREEISNAFEASAAARDPTTRAFVAELYFGGLESTRKRQVTVSESFGGASRSSSHSGFP